MKRVFSGIISVFTVKLPNLFSKKTRKPTPTLQEGANGGRSEVVGFAKTLRQSDIAHLPEDFQECIKKNGLARFTYDTNGKLTGAVIDYLECVD